MFLFKVGRLPDALKRLFSFSSSIHRYYTRRCSFSEYHLEEQILSVGSSLSCALKDQQRFDARLTIGKHVRLHGTLFLIMAFTCRPSPY